MTMLNMVYSSDGNESVTSATPKNNHLVMALVALLACTLMLVYLGKKSLWQDEALSVTLAKQDWDTFWLVLSKRPNMGLYHMMLHWWVWIGQSEFIVRSLSVIFAVATVPVAYALGARMFGSRVGIIAALLLTLNAFFIRYAQEARAYSLVLFLVTVSSYFLVLSIERPSWKYWIAYVISSVLAVYSHLFAVPVLLSQGISLVFLRRQDVQWKGFVISVVSIILLTLPLGILIMNRGKFGLSWIPQPNSYSLLRVFYHLVGGSLLLLVGYFSLCFIGLITAISTLAKHKRSLEAWRYFFMLTWLLVPIVMAFSYSFYKPIFWPRYFIICLPPLVLLASIGLSNIRKQSRRIFIASLAIMIILSGHSLFSWYAAYDKEGGEDWRRATDYIISRAQAGDTILFEPPYASLPFDYYLHRLNARGKIPDSMYDSSEAYIANRFQTGRWPEFNHHLIEQLAKKYHRIWVVGRNLRQLDNGQTSLILSSLQSRYKLLQSQRFKKITVLLYEISPL